MAEYRWVLVMVNSEVLVEFLTKGWKGDGVQCIEGLPAGAKLVSVRTYEYYPEHVTLIFEHESFAPTNGKERYLPILLPIYQRTTA